MTANYSLKMLHRPSSDEDYELLYEYFLNEIRELPHTWNLLGAKPLPDIGGGLVTLVSITRQLKRGMKGHISYLYRDEGYLKESDNNNDLLIIDFKSGKGLTKELVEISTAYIVAFDAYFLTINQDSISIKDWDKIVNEEIEFSSRRDILRINAINYYDKELCKNAFSLNPEEITERLSGEVELVKLVHNGVFFVVTSEELAEEQHIKIDSKIRKLLR